MKCSLSTLGEVWCTRRCQAAAVCLVLRLPHSQSMLGEFSGCWLYILSCEVTWGSTCFSILIYIDIQIDIDVDIDTHIDINTGMILTLVLVLRSICCLPCQALHVTIVVMCSCTHPHS